MARFVVIGDPIAHSLSPVMHQAAFEALNLPHTYEALRVPAENVAQELDRLRQEGYKGANVTVPLKEEAMRWSVPDDFAQRARSVNTIDLENRLGINTDGDGLVHVLASWEKEHWTLPLEPAVLLLGSGGSARPIALALADSGYPVAIWNRTHSKAVELAAASGGVALEAPIMEQFDVLINATSLSMEAKLPLPVTAESPDASQNSRGEREGQPRVAFDLYYTDGPTHFMGHMADLGWETRDGRELLVAQGALSFEFWLGVSAPIKAMRAAVGL